MSKNAQLKRTGCNLSVHTLIISLFFMLLMILVLPEKAQAATPDYDGALQAVITAIDNYEKTLDLSDYNLTSSDISTLENMIKYDYPQYIQYDYFSSIKLVTKGTKSYIGTVTLNYKADSASEVESIRNAYEEQIDSFLSHVDSDWTDFEKILYANDWLSIRCDYGYGDHCADAYGAIVLGKAICDGYSRAFKDLMNRLDIPCGYVANGVHAWNVVKLNSKWYYVDVTFNNPIGCYPRGSTNYEWLLLSRSAISADSTHGDPSGWSCLSSVDIGDDTDTTYDDYFWQDMTLPFYFYDGYWYAMVPQGVTYVEYGGTVYESAPTEYAIIKYKASSSGLTAKGSVKTLTADCYNTDELASWVSASWYDSMALYGNYTGFSFCGKYCYYASPHAIYCLDVTSGTVSTIYELTAAEKQAGYIDGIYVDDDGLLIWDLITGYDGSRIYTEKSIQVHTHSYTYKTTVKADFVTKGTKVCTCKTCGHVCTKKTAKVTCKKGKTYTVGNYTYKITSAKTDGTGTVSLTGLAKDVTKVTVAKTVKIKGATFKITKIADNALKKETAITSVSIGANVKSIGSKAFYGCTKLTKVTGCSSVTTIGDQAFYGCKKLATVSGCSSVTSVGSKTFYKCAKLTRIGSKKSRITLAKVKTIGTYAFYGCTSITYVNLSSTSLTTIGASAFRGCTKLATFISKSTKLKSIGSKAFYGDKKLASVTLKTSKLTSSNVKSNAFKGIKSTCTFKVPSKKVSSYTKLFQNRGASSKITVKKNS